MPAISPEDIGNMALDLLTESPIDSFDDDTKAARLLKRHFETTREAELTANNWRFAILRASLEEDAAPPASSVYSHQYLRPDDALRILPLTYGGEPEGRPIDHTIEGDYILTRVSGTLPVRYIGNLIDPNDFTALFTDVLAAALAIKIGHTLTGKASLVELSTNAYDRALRRAQAVNAIEMGSASPYRADTWEDARAGFRGYGW